MPNQNTQNPNPSQPIDGLNEVPFMPQSDIPPLPPEMTNPVTPPIPSTAVPTTAPGPEPTITTTPIVPATDSGSASPPAPAFSDITASPKKKFGGGKIIATILGVLVLVGGVAAAVLTINQKQLFQQKAAVCEVTCTKDSDCGAGKRCKIDSLGCSSCITATPVPSPVSSCSQIQPGAGCVSTSLTCNLNYGSMGCPTGQKCGVNCTSQTSQCGNCTLGTTQSCTTSDNKAGTQTCVNSGYCVGRVNAGNWGGCVATGGISGGTSGETGGSTTTTRSWPATDGTVQCEIQRWTGTPNSTIGGYVVFLCPNGCNPAGGCGESDPGVYWTNYSSWDSASNALSNYCGQLDTTNSSHTYCQADPTKYFDAKKQCENCVKPPTPIREVPIPTPTSTSTTVAPYCAAFVAYDADWNLLDNTGLSALTVGSVVNFCVTGGPLPSTFDKAKFIINGVEQAEITDRRSNSTDFCQNYTIPEGTTTFTISAQIHSAAGWF